MRKWQCYNHSSPLPPRGHEPSLPEVRTSQHKLSPMPNKTTCEIIWHLSLPHFALYTGRFVNAVPYIMCYLAIYTVMACIIFLYTHTYINICKNTYVYTVVYKHIKRTTVAPTDKNTPYMKFQFFWLTGSTNTTMNGSCESHVKSWV